MNNAIRTAALLLLASTAFADPPGLDPDRADSVLEEVKLNLLAVAWNEASSSVSPAEVRAFFHVHWTIAGGEDATPAEVLEAQRLFSPHVTQRRTLRSPAGNLQWSPHLRWSGAEPSGWETTGLPWERHRPRWNRERELISAWVDAHFEGDRIIRQCNGTPRGWGGPAVDDERFRRRQKARRARGAEPFDVLDCGETANLFFGFSDRRGSS